MVTGRRMIDVLNADKVRAEKVDAPSPPIPMLLHCPLCGERHMDSGAFATKPHHTHACQECGHVWRPAKVATVGVQFLPGYRDKDVEVSPLAKETKRHCETATFRWRRCWQTPSTSTATARIEPIRATTGYRRNRISFKLCQRRLPNRRKSCQPPRETWSRCHHWFQDARPRHLRFPHPPAPGCLTAARSWPSSSPVRQPPSDDGCHRSGHHCH